MSRNSSGNSSVSTSRKRGRPVASMTSRNPKPSPQSASWGANSPSLSRSSSRKSPFSDFGSYMAEKNRKLREQFDANVSGCGEVKGIFHGVSIFVDGHTIPSNQELKGYMLKHGGHFENYFSRRRVTHIICSNLPDSKLKNLRSFSRGLPVVKPMWILDSVAANKLLSCVPYMLEEHTREKHSQQKLSAFFSLNKSSFSKDADAILDASIKSEALSLSSKAAVPVGDCPLSNIKKEENEDPLDKMWGSSCEERSLSRNDVQKESCEFHISETGLVLQQEQTASESLSNQYSTGKEKTVTSTHCSKQRHCAFNDPNFVQNYFKNSRLHFIGTWRSRYRKRFPDNSIDAVVNNSVQNISTGEKHVIIHVDMDCFFVSVILRNHSELIDKPVAVCHSDNPKGTAEISSANYPARDYGIRAGMFVRDAKALCSNLIIFSYDFDAYEEVADQFYTILHKHSSRVQAVSCDEAFLDVTNAHEDPPKLASMIRHEIIQTTRCTASAGIAENLLLARLATRSAKPNGQYHIPPEKAEDFLKNLPIQALPGIGHVLEEKLKMHKIQTCGELRLISKDILRKDFGPKTGEMLWSYCRGIDNRMVGSVQETKSIGAEVNWGVRFKDLNDFQAFLESLCEEVSLRLQGCGMQGRTVTLKVKKRREGADEPTKYMGCGDCINMCRSLTVPTATDHAKTLGRISTQLFASLHVDVKEVRGIGLQISKLEHTEVAKSDHAERSIELWLSTASKSSCDQHKNELVTEEPPNCRDYKTKHIGHKFTKANNSLGPECSSSFGRSRDFSCGSDVSAVPPLSHLDLDVIKSLPSEIIAEVNDAYHGALSHFLRSSVNEDIEVNGPLQHLASLEESGVQSCECNKEVNSKSVVEPENHGPKSVKDQVFQDKGKQPVGCSASTADVHINPVGEEPEALQLIEKRNISESLQEVDISEFKGVSFTLSGISNREWFERRDLIPYSLSQVDASVFQQLPEDLKVDILEALPTKNRAEHSNVPSVSADRNLYELGKESYQYHLIDLLQGDPPRWVHEFRASGCLALCMLGEAFFSNGKPSQLSSILQSLISCLSHLTEDEWGKAFTGLTEFFLQYFNSRIVSDLEEVYVCFNLLKRLAKKSPFFLLVYNKLLPFIQEAIAEIYGGKLKFSDAIS